MMAVLRRCVAGVRWLVRLEIGIWRSLFCLLTRRVPGKGPGAQAFSYAREVTPLIGAFIFVSLIELPVVHLLLPWDGVRLVVDVISVWGLLWMIGMLASMKVFPHLLDDAGIRVRYGADVDIRIPWEAVESVKAARRSVATRKTVASEPGEGGAIVTVAVLKQTRVDVVLRGPTAIELRDVPEQPVELRLYADDARAFVAAARARLAERQAT